MNFKSSIRVLFLLAITLPSALISHSAGAVQSSAIPLEDIDISANTINKVKELMPQSNSIARTTKDRFNVPVNMGGLQCTADIINGQITNLKCPPILPSPNPSPSPGGPFVQMGTPVIKSNLKSSDLKVKVTPSAAEVLQSLSTDSVD